MRIHPAPVPAEDPTAVPVPPAPDAAPAPPPVEPAPASEVSDAAAALARRKHERAREEASDAPVRMADLHDLERAVDERLAELDRPRLAAPLSAALAPGPTPAARARRGAVVGWVVAALLLAVLVAAYVRGTRGGTL